MRTRYRRQETGFRRSDFGYWIVLILCMVGIAMSLAFGCAHKPIVKPEPEQPAMRYNSSQLNSKWGIIAITLPEQVPPGTFWNKLIVAEPSHIKGDIGVVLDADKSGNDYGLFVDLTKPHIYALIKIDADYNIRHWKYVNGVPVKCDPPEFFAHMGLEPQRREGSQNALPSLRKSHEI